MRLLLQRGVMATINQPLDAATAIQIAKEVGVEAAVVSFEEEMELSRAPPAREQRPAPRPACRARPS